MGSFTTASRKVDWGLHARFAALSGDHNPQHVDENAARRFFFGAPVVHGVHSLLWLLDEVCRHSGIDDLVELRASFDEPVFVGDEVAGEIRRSGDTIKAVLKSANGPVMRMRVGVGRRPAGNLETLAAPEGACNHLSDADLPERRGSVAFGFREDLLFALFPNLATRLPADVAGFLLASTRLVGMECPGYRSIFAGLKATFGRPSAAPLDYSVRNYDPRYRLVEMDVRQGATVGSIDCFLRPDPVAQPSVQALSALVKKNEFDGQSALIVGGSRGLGEVAAKIIAAGGGRVAITYHTGQDDADRVVQELREAGAQACRFDFDVLAADAAIPELHGVTHVYYFATPRIVTGNPSAFSPAIYRRYSEYYSVGLARTLQALSSQLAADAVVYYPSTIFIETQDARFREYAAAKHAGEVAARHMLSPGQRLVIDRLTRLHTDQTQSLGASEAADPADSVVRLVRACHSHRQLRAGEPENGHL